MATTAYLKSALDAEAELIRAGLDHDWLFRFNESLVQRARNGLAADFLHTTYEYLLFIDSDIEFRPEHIAALWNIHHDGNPGVAVGVYPMKKPGAPYAAWHEGKLVTDLDRFDGPIEVDYAGTGFMMINRRVFKQMRGELDIEHKATDREGNIRNEWDFFPCGIVNGIYESEDYGFCRRWREIGGKVVMDPSVRLIHHGQYAFAG